MTEGSRLEKELGLSNLDGDEFYEVIDKYLISIYNQKPNINNKEFTTKILEIYQTTEWNAEEELDDSEIEEDLDRYNLTYAEYDDCNMPILAASAYRYLMHYFNYELSDKYENMITNKKEWEFDFKEYKLDEETINEWKSSQVEISLGSLRNKYFEEHHSKIINSLNIKDVIDRLFIESKYMRGKKDNIFKEETTYGEEVNKVLSDSSYLKDLFPTAQDFIYEEYKKLETSPAIRLLGKRLFGDDLLETFTQSGSTRISSEDIAIAGYESFDEYEKSLFEAQIKRYGKDLNTWPCNLFIKKEASSEISSYTPLNKFERDIEDARRKYQLEIEERGEEYEYLFDVEIYKVKISIDQIDYFDNNFYQILSYIIDLYGEDWLEGRAFSDGKSIGEVKSTFVEVYQERFEVLNRQRDQELVKEVRSKLSTVLWPEGKEASDWWSKKADEKKIEGDNNYALLAEMVSSFHNKLIRGAEILNPAKDLDLSEQARILRDMIKTGQWFVSVEISNQELENKQ